MSRHRDLNSCFVCFFFSVKTEIKDAKKIIPAHIVSHVTILVSVKIFTL